MICFYISSPELLCSRCSTVGPFNFRICHTVEERTGQEAEAEEKSGQEAGAEEISVHKAGAVMRPGQEASAEVQLEQVINGCVQGWWIYLFQHFNSNICYTFS